MPRHVVVLALTLCVSSACKASFPGAPSEPTGIAGMQLLYQSPRASPLRVGDLFTVQAVTNDVNETYRTVTREAIWSSSDPSVVQVSSGVVRA